MNASVWILGDQLLDKHPALEFAVELAGSENVTVLIIESQSRIQRMPYHRKKLVLILSAMRHYAEELRQRSFRVDYRKTVDTLAGLAAHVGERQPEKLICMAASEYIGRNFQMALDERLDIPVTVLPNTQFLIGRYNPIPDPETDRRYMQEYFYRAMRTHFDLLMEPDGKPVGGQWNYDRQNRESLPGGTKLPTGLAFEPDEITAAVIEEVAGFENGIGGVDGFDLAVTRLQALEALGYFLDERLPAFGTYEDAMSSQNGELFHSKLSPYINLGLLEPLELARSAERAFEEGKAPINSVEGFIRQVIGWREFIYWQYWRRMPAMLEDNFWKAHNPLPGFFWDGVVEMNCLKHAIKRAIEHGYTHHIERLMLICNFCILAGIEPRQVNDWFLVHFIDAYDWVMAPNVLGMGLFADGGLTGTKPYIASANYIHKMSDYCNDCSYNNKQRLGEGACPFNYLYWNFLIENEETLRANPRMGPNVLGLRYLDVQERREVCSQAEHFLSSIRHR